MRKVIHQVVLPLMVSLSMLLVAGPAVAQVGTDLGFGPGCSAIGGIPVTQLSNGDMFTGIIGTTGATGINPNGKVLPRPDGDPWTASLEECINDSLIGYCLDLDTDDTDCISVDILEMLGKKGNRTVFKVTFEDVEACCFISECSDQIDNIPTDGQADFGGADGLPPDVDCVDYSDDSESPI